ncbi:MAG: methyltransferase domain-containing protein [Flavobacteriaceae bacterium TMED120]|nr:MAG: methyltransferase domain-containing protein [Flavobacteriaceae bacterium TMED120]HCQ24902.1 methyltransferase [Flavobacteriaceae bacterium]
MQAIANALLEYAELHSTRESKLLEKLRRETFQKVLHPRMLSGPLQGRLLSLISKLIRPKRILELGTYTGYATLCLSEGLVQDGDIHTIDKNEELIAIQNKYFKSSGKRSNIHQHLGEALSILPQLEGPFDLVFIDADKENTQAYFDLCMERVPSGGLILTDNVLWSGKVLDSADKDDRDTLALQEFNHKVANDSRVESLMLPLRDGITLSRVL